MEISCECDMMSCLKSVCLKNFFRTDRFDNFFFTMVAAIPPPPQFRYLLLLLHAPLQFRFYCSCRPFIVVVPSIPIFIAVAALPLNSCCQNFSIIPPLV